MKDFSSLEKQLMLAENRFFEIRALLSDIEVINVQDKFRALSKEYSSLEPIINIYQAYKDTDSAAYAALAHFKDPDLDVRTLAKEEHSELQEKLYKLLAEINILLLPKDPNDESNVFLEIRAGTGGDEAAIFVGDLLRMYTRYAQNCNWNVEIVSSSSSASGGYKEVIVRVIGERVYSRLKFESGVHRVQRVPETEAQGRVHTSTCTIAILPEVDAIEEFKIDSKDLRIDTYRASGAGGQHVNKTDSAIRITHLPSGLVVECQEERSQIKNRSKAMSLLQARLLAQARSAQEKEQAQTRKSLVGSGERCERIRTYNYSQGRVTDHRINLSLYRLPSIMEGDIGEILDALVRVEQAELLANINV